MKNESQIWQLVKYFEKSALTLTEYASDKVTANGKPSGTATTRTVTPIIKYLTKVFAYVLSHSQFSITNLVTQNCITRIITVSTAIVEPA